MIVGRIYRGARYRLRQRLGASQIRRNAHGIATIGDGVRISGDVYISGRDRMVLGDNVHIGTGAFIRAEGGLVIGDNCHISRNLLLYTMNHDHEGAALPYDATQLLRPVAIGRNVWIGMNVCIAPGSRIGDGAIIGMGSVIAGEVPPMAIVASQPWRIVGHRNEAHYAELDAAGSYGGSGGKPLASGHGTAS